MLKLFIKTGCPYCKAVLQKLHSDNIQFAELNIADEVNADEVVRQGGKAQVPFLVDATTGISMYESALIIDYLDRTYSKRTAPKTILETHSSDVPTMTIF